MMSFLRRLVYKLHKCYWWIFRPKTYGVRCVIKKENNILLVQHSYVNINLWSLPGGGVRRNEKPEEAVSREVEEELGLEFSSILYLGKIKRAKEYKRDTVYCFTAENDLSSIIRIDEKEIIAVRWFPLKNLPKNTSLFTIQVIKKFF